MTAKKLQYTEKAASFLLDIKLGRGWCCGPFYPGDTIRKAFKRLESLGYLKESEVTEAGKAWLAVNHIAIPLSH